MKSHQHTNIILSSVKQLLYMYPQTFQSEDAIAQSIHNIVERSFIGHIEEVFVVRIAGDILDLSDERVRVLLPPDVMS